MSSKKNLTLSTIFSKKSLKPGSLLVILLAGLVFAVLLTVTKFTLYGWRSEAALIISFENGERSRMFRGGVVDGMSVFQALVASTEAGQIKFEYSLDHEHNVIIEELNGYTKVPGKKLAFYLNYSKINSENINKIFIQGGDRIEIRPE